MATTIYLAYQFRFIVVWLVAITLINDKTDRHSRQALAPLQRFLFIIILIMLRSRSKTHLNISNFSISQNCIERKTSSASNFQYTSISRVLIVLETQEFSNEPIKLFSNAAHLTFSSELICVCTCFNIFDNFGYPFGCTPNFQKLF